MKTVSGESAIVTTEMTAPWNEKTLPTLLSNYKLEELFNADEFGLFYQCLPSKSYQLSGEKCSGATREKLEMFLIDKSKKPRCFRNVKQLPCRYIAQN